MGYLHAGHLALIEQARRTNEQVIVSIFVNPAQFGPHEDYTSYPRDPERDLDMLRQAGVDLVFLPSVEAIYPTGFQTHIEVSGVSQGLEGGRRPGHFRGVATVVGKLFNLTQPDRAYFGQKDAQQVAVIRRMVADLNFPLDIVVVPTLRAANGLALSSRNAFLSEAERAAAPVVYRALSAARDAYAQGSRYSDTLRGILRDVLSSEPLAQLDYVSVADAESLHEITGDSAGALLVSLAVRFGRTRLIDNIVLG